MVDKLLVERILADIKANVQDLRRADDITWDVYRTDIRARRYIERTLHITIEAMIDAAQHIIADEGWREALSYRDAFLVLVENGVLQRQHLPLYEKIASFRNLIVHYYEKVDDAIVYSILQKNLDDFDLFVSELTQYLQKW